MTLGEVRIPFGKHKGETLDDVASDSDGLLYLDWLAGVAREPFLSALAAFLAQDDIKAELDELLGRED